MSDSDEGPIRPLKIRKFQNCSTSPHKSPEISSNGKLESHRKRSAPRLSSSSDDSELDSSDECEAPEIRTLTESPVNEQVVPVKLTPVKLVRRNEGIWQKIQSSETEPQRKFKRLNPDLTPQESAKLVPVQLRAGVFSCSRKDGLARWIFHDGSVVDLLDGKIHNIVKWKS